MFWILVLLIIFTFGFPKVMFPIYGAIGFFLFGFWICSLFSSEPVGTFLGIILLLWGLAIFFILTGKHNKEDDEDKDDA